MKTKLFIPGLLIAVALLTFSCTNDDYETPKTQSSQSKKLHEKLDPKANNMVNGTTNSDIDLLNTEGDPEITRPTRKD